MTKTDCDWRQLPLREIWIVDTEFYPGRGYDNGGVDGDPITPLCLVALELRSGHLIRLWRNELGIFPPYRLDNEALFVGYMNAAEFGFHTAMGWGEPACSLDAYVEFRHVTNDGAIKSGEREKGFHSLPGALRYFLEDEIDVTHKKDMRDRILRGPPFTDQEIRDILDYCEDDVRGLARLFPHIIQMLRSSLGHAMFRSKFQWATAQHQHRGVPMDGVKLPRLRQHWQSMRTSLVAEMDQPFGCFEVVNGIVHWREKKFADYVRAHHMSWPLRADGKLDQRTDTIEEMCGLYPHLQPLRELKSSLSKLRLNDLAVGSDNRNRAPLWAFGTKTARNAPQASQFVFGPAKWLRFLITAPPVRGLVHRDFCQQEVRIAAILSGDSALLAACESGDVYLGIAHQLGFLPDYLNEKEREDVRTLFKTVVLGIQYGLGYRSLAMRTGLSLYEAKEILARLKAQFHRFADWADSVCDHAGLDLDISTQFGWHMQCPSGMNQRTIRNFPVQSTGSEILHVLCVLAERRGIGIVAPVHDAVMAEGSADQVEDLAVTLDQVMGDASALVLKGYRLPTDCQIIRPGERYFEKRGKVMWDTVTRLLTKLERDTA